MPRDYLDPELIESFGETRRATTLLITLGDGTPLRLATADIGSIGGFAYLGKLQPVDALNLELSRAAEGINLKIRDSDNALGQNLINTPNVLDNTKAVLGVHFKVLETGDDWHDVKIRGRITVGDIEDGWIPLFFKSETAAAKYNGKTIASVFPNTEIPVTSVSAAPLPVYDDLSNYPTKELIDERVYSFENAKIFGRYYLPFEINQV